MNGSIFCLSSHAAYRCHNSGACCSAGWPIPIEADRLGALRSALANGLVVAADSTVPPIIDADAATGAPALAAVHASRCVFHDGPAGRCRIHASLGHDALPLACRQFPRTCILDPRGTSIAMSAYCPTVAAELRDARAIAVVQDAPAFPADREYVGLDARDGLPPLLRPDMAMDWPNWWRFEAHAVALVAERDEDSATALARLRVAVDDLRTWTPDAGPLDARVERAIDRARGAALGRVAWEAGTIRGRVDEVVAHALMVPPGTVRPARRGPAAGDGPAHAPVPTARERRAFLAAHVFANWTAHLGLGLRSWLRSIEAAAAFLESGLSVRETDLWIRHLADPQALANTWSDAERA